MELKVSVTQKGKIFEGKAPEIINSALTSAMYEATAFLEKKVKRKRLSESLELREGYSQQFMAKSSTKALRL